MAQIWDTLNYCCNYSKTVTLWVNKFNTEVMHPKDAKGILGNSEDPDQTAASDLALYCLLIWATSWENQQNGMCAQRRLRSDWASAQSDQSLRCPHEETLGPWLPTECTAKTLIRLGGCPGWSESSLGAQSLCWFCHEAVHISPKTKELRIFMLHLSMN